MLKHLFYIILFTFSVSASAQQGLGVKGDDGLLIAYPNPTKDYIMLKTKNPNQKIKSVTFYSILGMQVAEYSINSPYTEIQLDKMKSGKYLLRYTLSDNTQKVMQIIKQ